MEVIGIGVGKSEFTGISLVSVSAKIWLSLTKDFIQFFQTYLITDTLLIKLLEALNLREFKPIDGMLSHHARRIYLVIFFCFLIENN
jgi:hypothetical protein